MRISTRHNGLWTVSAVLLALSVSLVLSSSATPESVKVQEFLRLIQKAGTLDEVSLAFDRAGFSPSEARELEAATGRPPYIDKLRSLAGPVGRRAGSRPEVTAKRVIADTGRKGTIDGRAAALARRLKARTPTAVRSMKTTASSPLAATASTIPPLGGGTSGRIAGLSPDPIRVCDRLIINGTGFGSGRGSVELVTPQHRYICDLRSWSDTRIEAVIPAYMDSVIGDRSGDFRLRVMLRGDSLGPYRDIRLLPSIHEPEIVSLSSDEIMPGCEIAIEGRWFNGRGGVEFDFGTQLFRGNIREWTDSLITAGIPGGIGGLTRTRGQIIIRNSLGRELRHPVTFEPDKEQVEISMYQEIDRSWKASGATETFDYFENFEMKPGWLVRSYRKEIVSGRGSARYMLEPVPGTTRIHNIITLDASSFTRLRVASRVTIEGPMGTPYW